MRGREGNNMVTFSDDDLDVLWAAMCSMVKDIHCAQDNLSAEDWERADRVFAQLDTRMQLRQTDSR